MRNSEKRTQWRLNNPFGSRAAYVQFAPHIHSAGRFLFDPGQTWDPVDLSGCLFTRASARPSFAPAGAAGAAGEAMLLRLLVRLTSPRWEDGARRAQVGEIIVDAEITHV